MKKLLFVIVAAFLAGSAAHAQQGVIIKNPATQAIPVDPSGHSVSGTSAGVDPGAGSVLGVQGITGNTVFGTANTTATTTTSLVSLVVSKKLYITAWNCANTGSTTSLITFQDGSGGTALATTIVPTGSGSNNPGTGLVPLFHTSSGNALFFAAASASTTIYCSASGFSGS